MLWTIVAQLYWGHNLAREMTQHHHCQIQPLSPHICSTIIPPSRPEPAPTAVVSAFFFDSGACGFSR